MIRHYQATAIDCDTCDETYMSDVTEVPNRIAEGCAINAGWIRHEAGDDGIVHHQCPACVKSGKRLEVAVEASS